MNNKKKSEKAEVEEQVCHGINLKDMDLMVKPGDDFYEYACGGWMKAHPLSERPDKSCYSHFTRLSEQKLQRLHDMFEELCKTAQEFGTVEQKIADLYRLDMDTERRNREDVQPIVADLKKIRAFKKQNLTRFLAEWGQNDFMPFIYLGVMVDKMDSTRHMLCLFSGGGRLPGRDYYLKTDKESKKIQQGYRDYMVKVFMLAGYSKRVAMRMSRTIYEVEYRFAEASLEREEMRNPEATYNVRTVDQLQKDYPAIDWEEYLASMGMAHVESVIVPLPQIMAVANDLLLSLTELQLRDYLTGLFIRQNGGTLSEAFGDAFFDFFGRALSGIKEKEPRWKSATSLTEIILKEVVGQAYVKKYFSQEYKAKAQKLIHAIRMSLASHIADRPWMSNATKIRALTKLNALTVKVGYPDKWEDYSDLTIDPERSFFENLREINKFQFKKMMRKLDEPVDRDEWIKSPQTINACYVPSRNEICFPAGILQPPFFDPEADDAVNYGAIAIIIGHEMTHGFDDQGRKYDLDGNLSGWWTDEDLQQFNAATERLVDQFNQIVVIQDQCINGNLTLGENIADLGGMSIALDAFKKTQQYREGKEIDGFTPLQRFFLSYAQMWAENMTDEATLLQTKNNCHPISRYRVNAILRNIDEFIDAFGIKPEDKMWLDPNDRIAIW